MGYSICGECNQFGQPEVAIIMKGGGPTVLALLDTGSPYNFIKPKTAEALGIAHLTPTHRMVKVNNIDAGKMECPVVEAFFYVSRVEVRAHLAIEQIFQGDGGYELVLGMMFLEFFDEFRLYPKEKRWELIHKR